MLEVLRDSRKKTPTSPPPEDFGSRTKEEMGRQCVEMVSKGILAGRIRKARGRQCQFFGQEPDCRAKWQP